MVELIDSIKDPVLRAFVWRAVNTFNASILPILGGSIILYFQDNNLPIALSSFASVELWDYVLGSVIISLASSLAAVIEKASRESSKIERVTGGEILDNQG
jgi:hypothetical protein